MYLNGHGVEKNSGLAISWYRKAIDRGSTTAMCNLAFNYTEGRGLPQDYLEAAKLYRRAAEQGDANAMNALGMAYEKGRVNRITTWPSPGYTKSAEAQHAAAMNNLSRLYETGRGTQADPAQAMAWARKAAKAGNIAAKKHLFELEAVKEPPATLPKSP